jgi:peptidoglycan hydrolase-like protein with peptidoglycan-binding domain
MPYNPKQIRVPAGSAGGGRFAAGSSGAAPTNAAPVQRGQSGADVRGLQQRLNQLGFQIQEDGVFGPETQRAVRALQQRLGLKTDGLVGPKTTAALRGSHVSQAQLAQLRKMQQQRQHQQHVAHEQHINGLGK